MSEYICVEIVHKDAYVTEDGDSWDVVDYEPVEKVVRCRDCKHYYEAENYHPSGNYVMRCCKYFDTYNDEVESDGFCKWGERRNE